MPLADPHLLTVLKVQIQIGGAFQISTTYAATLHYQMAYRLQNCILDMLLPTSTDEALFLTVNAPHQASCVHVPRQISRPELLKLLPKYWVTQLMKKIIKRLHLCNLLTLFFVLNQIVLLKSVFRRIHPHPPSIL